MNYWDSELKQIALQISNASQRRKIDLEKRRAALQSDLLQIEADLEAADASVKRIESFSGTIGGDPQCPQCWIRQGSKAALIPRASGTGADLFHCRICDFEVEFDP